MAIYSIDKPTICDKKIAQILHLQQLLIVCKIFSLFGMTAYSDLLHHSVRGAAFLSKELDEFLMISGAVCSRTTRYSPTG